MQRRPWTPEEQEKLRELYKTLFADEISPIIGRSRSSIYGQTAKLGLKSLKEKLIRAGKRGSVHPDAVVHRFVKGSVPHNKGKRMPDKTYAKVSSTMFKKGHKPANWRPVGSERTNADGYIEVKTAEPNKWQFKHRILWENTHGPIPKGFNIQFRNGNRSDVRLDNLYIIDRATQLAKENSMIVRYPEELQRVIRLRSQIKRQINKHKRNEQ